MPVPRRYSPLPVPSSLPHPSRPQVERLNKALEQSKSSEAKVAALRLQDEEASRALGDELAVSGSGIGGGGESGR